MDSGEWQQLKISTMLRKSLSLSLSVWFSSSFFLTPFVSCEYNNRRDGVIVPLGEFEPTGVNDGSLLYNEYVVYQNEQVKLRYVVCVDFCYDQDDDHELF